ncbi:MAG: hypothetical protein HC861_09560, partial [Rhodospirillaceae bacterium]|nr:hypothetical protein [Rhodospirillaceae bacterium]
MLQHADQTLTKLRQLIASGGSARGAVHLLFLNTNGTVKSHTKIASGTAAAPALADNDRFGDAVAAIGDLD